MAEAFGSDLKAPERRNVQWYGVMSTMCGCDMNVTIIATSGAERKRRCYASGLVVPRYLIADKGRTFSFWSEVLNLNRIARSFLHLCASMSSRVAALLCTSSPLCLFSASAVSLPLVASDVGDYVYLISRFGHRANVQIYFITLGSNYRNIQLF